MRTVTPVILSGGSGTRLWPLSRGLHPKQFMNINGQTLFGDTVIRALALPKVAAPIVICNEAHRFLAAAILQEKTAQAHFSRKPHILLEPQGRNTAPAVALCAMSALSNKAEPAGSAAGLPNNITEGRPGDAAQSAEDAFESADPLLLVLSSDHRIEPQAAFTEAVTLAAEAAAQGKIVVFGVPPTRPETGYGYIRHGHALVPIDADTTDTVNAPADPSGLSGRTDPPGLSGPVDSDPQGLRGIDTVDRFLEKPSREIAESMLKEGGYSWNSGMFLFRASVFLRELAAHAPDVLAACTAAWQSRTPDLDFIRFDPAAFAECPAVSIDYAVMEHTKIACVVPLRAHWQDMGSWDAFYESGEKDAAGNACAGDVVLLDSRDSYVHADHRMVAAVGVSDLSIVETADAVLVIDRKRSQDVKTLLETLKKQGRAETETHLRVYRPWGSYETLVLDGRFQVKRIIVLPGATLSLQLHHHRAEHWIVVGGTAKVTVGDEVVMLTEDMSTYIPLGVKHRLENPGRIPLELIEVQSGAYLGEDDIVRFEDVYGRSGE